MKNHINFGLMMNEQKIAIQNFQTNLHPVMSPMQTNLYMALVTNIT